MPAQAGDTHDFTATRKSELRVVLRRRRTALSPAERRHAARAAAAHLLRSRVLKRTKRIALYLSHGHELDTAPLLRALHRLGLQVYVPVTLSGHRLCFVRLCPGMRLRRGRYGIRQPAASRPRCDARRLQLILLPLLGFDHAGHRLGQGGGYYDRSLANCRNRQRPMRLGYAYAAQEVDALPFEAWDVRLDGVVSERGLRRFRRP